MKIKELITLSHKLSKSKNRSLNFANWVAFVSVVVGSLALVVSLSILNGFDNTLKTTASKFTSHIVVQNINSSNIPITRKSELLAIENVRDVVPILQNEAMLVAKKNTEGVLLKSLANSTEKNFEQYIKQGTLTFSSDTTNEIIVGESLLNKLDAKIGDDVLIYTMAKDAGFAVENVQEQQFKIKATYSTGMVKYDDNVAFVPKNTLAKMLNITADSVSYFEVYVDNLDNVAQTAMLIDSTLGFPVFSVSYYDINRNIFSWIELQKEPIPSVLAIISIVAALNIITMLIITIVEKTHSIGILRTLGLNNREIVGMFVGRAIETSVSGSIMGIVLSVTFILLQTKFTLITLDPKIYYIDKLPVDLQANYIFIVLGGTVLLSIIAAIVPSLIAIKVSPIRAIRFK